MSVCTCQQHSSDKVSTGNCFQTESAYALRNNMRVQMGKHLSAYVRAYVLSKSTHLRVYIVNISMCHPSDGVVEDTDKD